MPIIPKTAVSVEQFLNECLQSYRASRPTLDLKLVIDMITAAKQEGNYLEARALQLVATMEFIKGQVIQADGKLTIIDDSQFSSILTPLMKRVGDAIADLLPGLSKDQVRQLSNHVQGLNWYPFRAAMRDVGEKYSVGLTSKELQKFIAIRNKLVHEYAFDSLYGEQMEQFHFLENVLTRIVLSVLQYQGQFYDWSCHMRAGSPRLTTLQEDKATDN